MTIYFGGRYLPEVKAGTTPPHQIGTAVGQGFALNSGFARADGHPTMDYPATTWNPPQPQVAMNSQTPTTGKVVHSAPALPTKLTGN